MISASKRLNFLASGFSLSDRYLYICTPATHLHYPDGILDLYQMPSGFSGYSSQS